MAILIHMLNDTKQVHIIYSSVHSDMVNLNVKYYILKFGCCLLTETKLAILLHLLF